VPTAYSGYVLIAIDCDPADPPPSGKAEFLNLQGASRCPVWSSTEAWLVQSRAADQRYVRISDLGANLDIKTYDSGVVYVATGGTGGVYPIGELWLDYEVELAVPQVQASLASSYSAKITGGGTMSPSKPLGSTPAIAGDDTEFLVEDTGGSNTYLKFLKLGEYFVELIVNGTGIAAGPPNIAGLDVNSQVVNNIVPANAGAFGVSSFVVSPSKAGATMLLSLAGLATTITYACLRISPYRRNLG